MDKKQLIKLTSFFTMADGGVYKKTEKGGAYFAMNMLSKHMDYILWVKEVMEELTSVNLTPVVNPCKQPQHALSTRMHPHFEKLRERIYVGGYKGLCPHAMKLLDWECLAILYMADGSLYIDKRCPSPDVRLNMKRLSYGDQAFLKKRLKEEFNLEWNICKGRTNGKTFWSLRLRTKDVQRFVEGVLPHIKPSFLYKLYDSERKAPMAEKP
ncbi:hypothetical protein QE321_gp087 [Pseudomonas phage SPA01]|uniref:Homing endonuclease LAGLIDADG domain-containing protein n=1 Tax=Pseudomonas phage SPA01 TaxID=3003719 RepID=A0A9Y1QZJ1_9CAUD|nr:hypothetical protein QE321_gp087 [Pseudomonas phage SPA01]WFG74172.1 hypothetical protein DOEKDBNA_00131 [Pseudomonas phage SPA01]